ncbi:MAG: hypothetical protein KDJ52_01715 [Anaerolineae bacterium]|nr:hypothetical protein [Anaerolineae bacterium]
MYRPPKEPIQKPINSNTEQPSFGEKFMEAGKRGAAILFWIQVAKWIWDMVFDILIAIASR